MPRTRSADRAVNIADLRELARRRLPRMVFDYIDGGAEDELTLRENGRVFDGVRLRPRCGVAPGACALGMRVLGHELELPILLAPVGSARLFWPRGEAAAAKAAGRAGTVYVLSTFSGTRLEEVRAASSGPCWYQLYLAGGRDVALRGMARAKAAGFGALVVTIDTPVAGMRERDLKNGVRELVARRFGPMLPYLGQLVARPRWLLDFQERHPAIRIEVYRNLSESIPSEVIERNLDFGFLSFDPKHPTLESRVVYRDRMAFVVSPGTTPPGSGACA